MAAGYDSAPSKNRHRRDEGGEPITFAGRALGLGLSVIAKLFRRVQVERLSTLSEAFAAALADRPRPADPSNPEARLLTVEDAHIIL